MATKNKIGNLFLIDSKYRFLLVMFILVNIALSLPFIFINVGKPFFIISASLMFIIIGIPIRMFFYAGLYGLTFLKLNGQPIDAYKFIKLCRTNFIAFIKIAIITGLCGAVLWNALEVFIKLLPFQSPEKLIGLFYAAIFPVIEILFVFSYPLAVMGYFAQRKLNPIKSSFSLILKHPKENKFVFVIMGLQIVLSLFRHFVGIKSFSAMGLILTSIETVLVFLLITYSFGKLTADYFNDLFFDFNQWGNG